MVGTWIYPENTPSVGFIPHPAVIRNREGVSYAAKPLCGRGGFDGRGKFFLGDFHIGLPD